MKPSKLFESGAAARDWRDVKTIDSEERLLRKISDSVFKKTSAIIDKKFNDGLATCTHASRYISTELDKYYVPHTIHGGDFNDSGHFWVETKSFIIDNGDNISDAHMKSGHIKPKVILKSSSAAKKYKSEEVFTPAKYKSYYAKVKKF